MAAKSDTSAADDILRMVCMSAYHGARECVEQWGDAPEHRDEVLLEYLLAEASRTMRLYVRDSHEATALRRLADACLRGART